MIERRVRTSLLSIIVGVTGHRELNTDRTDRIKKIFRELDRKYPNTPIYLLSPLAEGADRLVARAALETKRLDGTYPILICPFPMAVEDYKASFDSEESKTEFELLRSKAKYSFNLSLSRKANGGRLPTKKMLYKEVGLYIARHSHILIAVWDGNHDREQIGGTTQIVRLRHEGKLYHGADPINEIAGGPIYHLQVARTPDGIDEIVSRKDIFPGMDLDDPQATKSSMAGSIAFDKFLSRLDVLNYDIKNIDPYLLKEAVKSRAEVFPESKLEYLSDFSRQLLDLHVVTDKLAIGYQFTTNAAIRVLFVLAFFSLFAFEVYAHLWHNNWVLFLYPLILLIGLLLVTVTRYLQIQRKHLYFRAVSESLRVQFFLHLSGNKKLDYPVHQNDRSNWLDNASRTVAAIMSDAEFAERAGGAPPHNISFADRLRLVLDYWVKKQHSYFANLAATYGGLLKKRHKYITRFFFAGPALSLVLLVASAFVVFKGVFELPYHLMIIAIGSSLAIAAVIGGYTGKTAIATKAERYRWMGDLFGRADRELNRRFAKGAYTSAGHLIFELGEIAMNENADWLTESLERGEIEYPTG